MWSWEQKRLGLLKVHVAGTWPPNALLQQLPASREHTLEGGCFPAWHPDHGRAPAACCSGGTWLVLCCCLSGTGQEQCQAPSCSPLVRAGFDFSTMREEEDRRGAVSTIWSTGWNVASWCCLKPTSRAIPLEALKVRPCFHYRQQGFCHWLK